MHIKGNFNPQFVNDINYYKGKCGMCQNYQLQKTTHRGCQCRIHTLRALAFDDTCSRQRDDRSRSIKDIKKAFENCRGYDPAIYYIATIVNNILNTEKSQFYYDLIKEYWQDIFQNNPKYQEFLEFYDFYGHIIANLISKDKNKEQICLTILNNYFVPIGLDLQIGNYDKAFKTYQDMVLKIRLLYAEIYQNFNQENLEDKQITRIRRF